MQNNLFSVKKTINGKDYYFKIGNKELIEAEDIGIDINKSGENMSIKILLQIAHIAIQLENKMTFDEFIDFIDNSDMNNEELGEVIEKCIDKGIMKGKKTKIQQKQI